MIYYRTYVRILLTNVSNKWVVIVKGVCVVRKFVAFVYLIALLLSMAACELDNVSSVQLVGEYTKSSKTTEFEKILVFDDYGLSVTLENIRYESSSVECDFSVENHSDDNATLSGATFVVNGAMIDTFLYAQVASGTKARCTLYFDSADLIKAGIEEIYSIVSYDSLISFEKSVSKDISLDMIFNESQPQYIDSTGKVLYDQNGITVISKFDPGEQNDSIPLLVLNESGLDFSIWTEYVAVNGCTVPVWNYSYVVCDGSVRFFEIDLVNPDIGGADIDTIETASFTLDFKIPGSSTSIYKAEELEI